MQPIVPQTTRAAQQPDIEQIVAPAMEPAQPAAQSAAQPAPQPQPQPGRPDELLYDPNEAAQMIRHLTDGYFDPEYVLLFGKLAGGIADSPVSFACKAHLRNGRPIEQALVGSPIADAEDPVELGHVARSFDSCLVCTVHAYDGKTGRELSKFVINGMV